MATDALLPLSAVTDHLRIVGQNYVGMRTIPIDHIVGSVDRSVDFDRFFRPRKRGDLNDRLKALRQAFRDRPMPPISVYEASELYFVADGHHRVALARQDGGEFIDAEVTALHLSHSFDANVDMLQLVHTEQHRQFEEHTGLLVHHPEATIEFSRPIGYAELTEIIDAHAYELSAKHGALVPMAEATADWYESSYLPGLAAIQATALPRIFSFKTPSDTYLWTFYKLRELRTYDRSADWPAAAAARASEPVQRSHVETARRERRTPLPTRTN